jgi:rhodanese-related sulfurtransferase
MNRVWRHDLAWAGFILLAATVFGLMHQWPLVRQAWQGDLAARLDQERDRRRQEQFQGVKTLNLAQAYALFQQGGVAFIDARRPEPYAELHIAKALNITPSMLEDGGGDKVAGLAKDQEIVVYCGEVACDLALRVAELLQARGFTRVMAYVEGFKAWDEAGYPADTSK